MRRLAVFLFLSLPFVLKAQIISTFAGGGSGGSGSSATAASLYDVIGGVFDRYGNYYCAGGVGNKVIKVSNSGIYTIFAGNGSAGYNGDSIAATNAEVNEPTAVKLDALGNIYICDAGDNRIRKVDAGTGIITTIAGNSGMAGYNGDNIPATSAMLNLPQDICFDRFGNIYIADVSNFRIRKIDTSGIITTFAGTGRGGYTGDNGPATNAKFGSISGIAMDDTGNLYIAGSSLASNVVRKINPAGIITTFAGVNGTYTYLGDGIAATNEPMSPIKIDIDPFGELIIADNMNYRVLRVNSVGIIYSIAGNGVAGFSGDGGSATGAELNYPSGIAFDTCGNLYIAEASNFRIRKVGFNPSCTPLIIIEEVNPDLLIYPNPASEELHIDGVKSPTSYRLLNITGIIEQSGTLQEGTNTIGVRWLARGMYLLEMTDERGYSVVMKVSKM